MSKYTIVDEAGAADGVCAVLTKDGAKEMNRLAQSLDRRWTKHNATCKLCQGA